MCAPARSTDAAFVWICIAANLNTPANATSVIFSISAWRDAPYYTDAERAALAVTEAVTRLNDREDPVPDEIWNDAKRHYTEKALGSLVIQIALINAFNRLNVATRQQAGVWAKSA